MNRFSFAMQLSTSRFLSFYLVLIHMALISIVCVFALSSLITQLIIVITSVHWAYCRWRYNDDSYPYWVSRVVFNNEHWSLTANNKRVAVTLIYTTVWRQLTVMGFQGSNPARKYHIVVFPDSVDAEIRRQLRVIITHLPVWNNQL